MAEPLSQRRDLGRLAGAALAAALALALLGCASVTPSRADSASGLVAPSGQILLPPCPASAACLDGFVVGDTHYGISCYGIEPTDVEDETLARGSRQYDEARAIKGIPPDLWLAVRGDLACAPREGEPLLYEWYLAHGPTTQADIEEWGQRVAELTLPREPDPGSDSP